MWVLDYKENWALKSWCFWTVVLEKTLESPLDCKEIQPVDPKGHQSWLFIGRTDAEAGTPILWPPDAKNWFIGKDPDTGKDWRRVEKRMTEDEMVGWHHWLSGHEFEWTPGVGDRLGNLEYCNPWGCEELDTTKWRTECEMLYKCEMISHCGFHLEFLDDESCWASLHVPVGHLYVFFRKKYLFRSSAHILIELLFDVESYEFLVFFWY